MWVYVPSSHSAQESAASTLGLESLSHALEPSVTWKGKLLPRRSWLRALKTAPWTKRLFGRTCERLTASRGAAEWIASLPAIRANRSVARASSKDAKIHATSGRTSRASSAKWSRNGSSLRTSPTICGSDFAKSPASYDAWATGLRQDCLRRLKLARLISESVSSSWLTPHGMSGQDHTGKNGAGGEFAKQATRWGTPTIGTAGGRGQEAPTHGSRLQDQSRNWPTARSEDAESCGNHPGSVDSLTGAAKGWQTPATDSFRSRGGDRINEQGLDQQARTWPTTQEHNGQGAPGASCKQRGSRRSDLVRDAAQWPTPVRGDHRSGVTGNIAKKNARPLCEVACQSSLQARTTSPRGKNSSASIPRLNPRFVEMLMGFPVGWTDCAPLEMASFLSWRQLPTERSATAAKQSETGKHRSPIPGLSSQKRSNA